MTDLCMFSYRLKGFVKFISTELGDFPTERNKLFRIGPTVWISVIVEPGYIVGLLVRNEMVYAD